MHVTVVLKLKIGLNKFFGKNLIVKFFVQKGLEVGPKRGFTGIIKSQCMELFRFLHEIIIDFLE